MNKTPMFRVPDVGTVEIDNAVFVHFLQSLKNLRGEPIKLADMQVGQRANAVFQSGAGFTRCEIERME